MASGSNLKNKGPRGVIITQDTFAQLMEPHGPYPSNEKIAVAVSGGPDSMALTCLLKAWGRSRGLDIIGLTVDHQLRETAAEEAEQVSVWLRELGLSHHTLVWQAGKTMSHIDSSPQAAAREARYSLLVQWCLDNHTSKLLIAHHADDQAETFLQRLVRGSGIDGLASMRASVRRNEITLLRPLLLHPKADLIATCEALGQSYINDPSNQDQKYGRVRFRNLLRALAAEGLDRDRLLNTVNHIQRAKAAIDAAVDELVRCSVTTHTNGNLVLDLLDFVEAPEEVALRSLAHCLCQVSCTAYPPRFNSLMLVFNALKSDNWSDRTLHGCQLRMIDGKIVIAPESQERQNSGGF